MLHLDKLRSLSIHRQHIHDLLPQKSVFFVGGCVRDLLLNIVDNPTDLDLTMAGTPEEIREQMQIDDTTTTRFRTEKFGTMSLLPRDESGISYEITPFRAESGYADYRHPDEIIRSHDLLQDSARRDFTINCLYRTEVSNEGSSAPSSTIPKKITDDIQLLTLLKEQGGCRDINSQTIILQDHDLIRAYLTACSDSESARAEFFATLFPVWYTPPHTPKEKLERTPIHRPLSILLDPHHGINDLVHRTLRCVGDPQKRFSEDALRVIRGLRFVNTLNQRLPDIQQQNSGFDIDKTTRKGMELCAPLVQELASERLHQELVKVFQGTNPFGYIALLRELQLMEIMFPALHACIGNRQPVRYHPFDTYDHTLLTLWHLQERLPADTSETPQHYLVKLAMLYHDVGKPQQYAFMEKAFAENPDNPDRTGYEHHADISVRLAVRDFKQLAFSTKEIETICRYIKRHHRPGEILDAKTGNRQKKLRKLLSEGDLEMTLCLFDIAIADRLGQYNPLQVAAIQELEELKTEAVQLYAAEGRFTMKELAIDGNEIMQEFSLAPGPQVGHLLVKAFDRVLEKVPDRNTKQQILTYLKKNSK